MEIFALLLLKKLWISIFIQIACDWICFGQNASPKFTQAYTAFEFFAVICQNEYLIITGVLYPTPSSRNNICKFLCLRRNSSYRSAARYQPLSCTKVSSARRFIVIGLPHFGQCGISSVGIRIFFCVFSIMLRCHKFPDSTAGNIETVHSLLAYKTVDACRSLLSEIGGQHSW